MCLTVISGAQQGSRGVGAAAGVGFLYGARGARAEHLPKRRPAAAQPLLNKPSCARAHARTRPRQARRPRHRPPTAARGLHRNGATSTRLTLGPWGAQAGAGCRWPGFAGAVGDCAGGRKAAARRLTRPRRPPGSATSQSHRYKEAFYVVFGPQAVAQHDLGSAPRSSRPPSSSRAVPAVVRTRKTAASRIGAHQDHGGAGIRCGERRQTHRCLPLALQCTPTAAASLPITQLCFAPTALPGGHTAEMLMMVEQLDKAHYAPRVYVTAATDRMSGQKALAKEQAWGSSGSGSRSGKVRTASKTRHVQRV